MKKGFDIKKLLGLILVVVLTLSSLTGCSSDKKQSNDTAGNAVNEGNTDEVNTDEEIVIRFTWWGNQTRNDGTVKALEMYEAEHPNVKFEVEFSDWNGYWDKLSTQAAGGNLPDIIQMDYGYIRQYAEKDLLYGMNEFIDEKVIDTSNVPESIMSSGLINGDIYGICAGLQSKALLVNTDVLEEAGVTLSKQPTYKELFEVAKTVYEKTGVQMSIPSNDEQTMLFIARSMGQTIYNEAGNGLGMPDDKIALRYFSMLKETLDEGYHVSPEIMAEASTNQQSLFAAGKEWLQFTNSNMITNTINQCEDGVNYAIHMYPTEEDATQQPLFLKPSMFYSIAQTSEYPEIAADVINYLTNSEEANKEALKGERGVPISSVVSKEIESVVDEVTANINAYVTEVGEVATPIDPPFPAAAAEIGKTISDLSDMIRYGEISPEDAASQFYNKAIELLEIEAE